MSYISKQKGYSLISKKTPLISNLNIVENIALIKEVHQFLPTKLAQKEANNALNKLNLIDISLLRPEQCSSFEVFLVCLIRAIMTKDTNVIIVTPFHLIDDLDSFEKILDAVKKLDIDKNIFILDIVSNKIHYKGYPCTTIE